MKIALLHFHLNTGGVTSVIRDQVLALQTLGGQYLVLTGSLPEGPFPAPLIRIPGLAYDRDVPGNPAPRAIADDILTSIHRHWPAGADILHVHNPTLAKNRLLQEVLKILQRRGQHLLCQIHDFAEDGRPDAFFQEPYVNDSHYAVINPRDLQMLLQAGLDPKGCHLLPNAIHFPASTNNRPSKNNTVLFPVRAIRRKNIGEAILLSFFFKDGHRLAVTLPPNSPEDIEHYRRWRDFVDLHGFNVWFEAGGHADFKDLLAGCRYVLTTSITEGFGFTFLESWAAGKALWGRSLPDICQGFVQNGLRLDHLYESLKVPIDWIDRHELTRRWKSAMRSAAGLYGIALSSSGIAAAWESVSAGGFIDFGLLEESFQRRILENLAAHRQAADRLIASNPFLSRTGPPEASAQLIAHNRDVVKRCYNQTQYAQRLKTIYKHVIQTEVRHRIDKKKIAQAFLAPHRFSLLKWGGRI